MLFASRAIKYLHSASFCVQFQSFDQVKISSQTMRLSICDELLHDQE